MGHFSSAKTCQAFSYAPWAGFLQRKPEVKIAKKPKETIPALVSFDEWTSQQVAEPLHK